MASGVGMGVSLMLFPCQLLTGSLCRVVGTFVRKMANPLAIVLSLFLLLSVHGSAVVARIKFTQPVYTVNESPEICLDIVNELHDSESPLSNRVLVTAKIDKILLGKSDSGSIDSFVEILSNSSIARLCFDHPDDEVTCEAPIVGNVRLLSSPQVTLSEPSTAMVTIMDDDAMVASFERSSYTYSESGLKDGEAYPVITSCKIQDSIKLMVRETYHWHRMSTISLNFPDTMLRANNLSQPVVLRFIDDNVALEQLEVVKLELTSVPSPDDRCSIVHIEPYNTTTIYIEDDDVVTISILGSEVHVREDDGHGQVCVEISLVIARPIEFELWLNNGTAESGLDFSKSLMTGQFEAFSNNKQLCFDILVFADDLVEGEESFDVSLHLKTKLPPSLTGRVKVDERRLRVTIIDTSHCTHVDLGASTEPTDSSVHYISQQTSVCFACGGSLPNLNVYWSFGDYQLSNSESNSKGRIFPNGTLMITNSSQTFNTENTTSLSCTNSQNSEFVSASVYLGAAPSKVTLTYRKNSLTNDKESVVFMCSYSGSPQPKLTWLLNNSPLPERGSDSFTLHTSRLGSSFDSVLTMLFPTGKTSYNYSCVVANQFGQSSSSVVISLQASMPSTGGTPNSALSINKAVVYFQITVTVMVLMHLLLFVHLI